MLFVNLLVFLFFFAILHWNRNALYAPSDFQDERNYAHQLRPASPLEIIEKQIAQEITDSPAVPGAAAVITGESTAVIGGTGEASGSVADSYRARTQFETDKLTRIVHTISRETGLELKSDIVLQGKHSSYLVDAAGISSDRMVVVEILKSDVTIGVIQNAILSIEKNYLEFEVQIDGNFEILLVIMLDDKDPDPKDRVKFLKTKLGSLLSRLPFEYDFRFF